MTGSKNSFNAFLDIACKYDSDNGNQLPSGATLAIPRFFLLITFATSKFVSNNASITACLVTKSCVAASLNLSLLGAFLFTNHNKLSSVSIAFFHIFKSSESNKFARNTLPTVSSGIYADSCLPFIPNIDKPTNAFSIFFGVTSVNGSRYTDTSKYNLLSTLSTHHPSTWFCFCKYFCLSGACASSLRKLINNGSNNSSKLVVVSLPNASAN